MQKRKRNSYVPLKVLSSAVSVCILIAGILGCQQPAYQLQPKTKPQPTKPAYQDKSTHQGLEKPKTLSRTQEEFQERAIEKKSLEDSKPELNAYGIPVKYIKTETKYSISAAFEDNILLDPAHHSIYPGSVLAGDSIDDGTYREIAQGQKRDATISFSLQGVKDKNGHAGIVSGTLKPNLSAYRQLHNQVLSQKISYTASANSSYEEVEVKNEESFNAKFKVGIGFAAAGIKAKIGAGFKFKGGEKTSRHLIRFIETFYTVDVNQESAPLMTDIPQAVLGTRMPVYVSSVSYGRIAYLSIETEKRWKDIEPYLDAVLKATPNTLETEIKTAIDKLNEMTRITINVIGGGSESPTTLAQFRKYIVKDGFSSGNPGQIIKYKLRFLDNNAAAYIKYAGQYTEIERLPVTGKGIKVTAAVSKVACHVNDHGTPDAEVFGTIDIYPQQLPLQKKRIFDHDRNTNALSVPCTSSLDIPPNPQSIVLPSSQMPVSFFFNIKERNYTWVNGDRFFVIDSTGKQNQPTVRRVEDLEKQKSVVFMVYEQGNPQETMSFTINFTVEYLF